MKRETADCLVMYVSGKMERVAFTPLAGGGMGQYVCK